VNHLNDLIRTQSLPLSAYLLTKSHNFEGFRLEELTRSGEFVFRKDPQIAESISSYYMEDPPVPIRTFLKHLNHLRDVVMEKKREMR
jgi:Domain of unknown function (DUF5659)